MAEIAKSNPVRISSSHLVGLLVDALEAKIEAGDAHFYALGYLVGISDVDAVRAANKRARANRQPTITVAEFRKWLPKMLSEIFEEWRYG